LFTAHSARSFRASRLICNCVDEVVRPYLSRARELSAHRDLAPATRSACSRATHPVAAARRVRAPAPEFRAVDWKAALPAAARSAAPESVGALPEVRSASTS
jgi:hypothetical protein